MREDEEDSEEVVSNTVDLNVTMATGLSGPGCEPRGNAGTARGAQAEHRRQVRAPTLASAGPQCCCCAVAGVGAGRGGWRGIMRRETGEPRGQAVA